MVYDQFKTMIERKVWSFNRTTGLSVEVLRSEAYFAFACACADFDSSHAAFSTWLTRHLEQQLTQFVSKEYKAYRALMPEGVDLAAVEWEGASPEERTFRHIMLEQASPDAKHIIRLLVNGTPEIFKEPKPRKIRGNLFRYLKDILEWPDRRIYRAFNELKGIVRSWT